MDDDIKKYTARIDSIVTSEKLKMNDEMNLVEKNFQSGNLSSEELKARKMTIAEKYEKTHKTLNLKVNIFAKFSSFCFHKQDFLSCCPASALFFLVKNPVKSSSAAIYPLLSSQAAY
jgi:hypothetical protein